MVFPVGLCFVLLERYNCLSLINRFFSLPLICLTILNPRPKSTKPTKPIPNRTQTMSGMKAYKKGAAIFFCGGTYCNKTGWFNDNGDTTECKYSIIINFGNGKVGVTKVNKDLVMLASKRNTKPKCYMDAILKQHPDIDLAVNDLCNKLAQCCVKDVDHQDIMGTVMKGVKRSTENFKAKGFRARFRPVHFQDKGMEFNYCTDGSKGSKGSNGSKQQSKGSQNNNSNFDLTKKMVIN